MATSNTFECFRECIGKKIVGVLKDIEPPGTMRLGYSTFVFDDGTGLTIASNGSYWQEPVEDIRKYVDHAKAKLKELQADTQKILELAGEIY